MARVLQSLFCIMKRIVLVEPQGEVLFWGYSQLATPETETDDGNRQLPETLRSAGQSSDGHHGASRRR